MNMAFIRANLMLFCFLSNAAVHFALPATMYPTTVSNRANRIRQNVTGNLDPELDLEALRDVENRPPGYLRPTKSASTTEKPKNSVAAVTKDLLSTTLSPPSSTVGIGVGPGTQAPDGVLITTKPVSSQPANNSTKVITDGVTSRSKDTTTPNPRTPTPTFFAMPTEIKEATSVTYSTATPSATKEPSDFIPSPPCHINASSLSPIKIIVTWQAPINVSVRYIAGYTVYYFRSKYKDKEPRPKPIKLINAATYASFRDISGLNPGTNYTVYLRVNFTNNVSMTSQSVWVITKGYGPDRPCICDPMGAVNVSICDGITGQCPCRDLYAGLSCSACRPGFYRFPRSPCAPCPCNLTVSTGVCGTEHSQVMCMCRGDNIGPRCEICKNGFYLDTNSALCKTCDCHGNAKLNSPRICDENTGKCLGCQFNTTGFKCEKCLLGYTGDPIVAKNCTKLEVDNTSSSPVDIIKKLTHRGHVVIGVSVTFGLIFFVIIGILGCKRYLNWRRWQPQPFWTVELKDDHETVSFSSMVDQEYQNVDAALLMDDVGYYDQSMQGQLRVKSPENTPSYHSINA